MAEGSFSWPFDFDFDFVDVDAVTCIDVTAVDGFLLLLSLYSSLLTYSPISWLSSLIDLLSLYTFFTDR